MRNFFMKIFLSFFILAFFLEVGIFAQNSASQKFTFKYKKDDSYKILSTINENVFVNGQLNHKAEILNRISVSVTDAKDGSGTHDATFMTSENSTGAFGGIFSYGEDYKSVFVRDAFGKYSISDEYFMPVVRDVPIFPDEEISPGEKWTAEGHEAHDLRRTFGIMVPYKIPFLAEYQYLGIENDNGKAFHKFDVKYTLAYKMDSSLLGFQIVDVPIETKGFSHQTIFWDSEKGYIDHYNEEFQIEMKTSLGNVFVFNGIAHAEVTEFETTSDEKNLAAVIEKIQDLGIKDVSVTRGEKGLTIAIENIQFMPDSDILMATEKAKLNKIAKILNAYPNNDLLVTGHTALRGTAEDRKKLSEQRAQSVANYLIKNKVRDKYHVFTKGMGGDAPIADNSTEEGRIKNRRVEITIMDK